MNVRKRSGCMGGETGSKPKNAVTQRVDGMTQASKIANTVTTPKAVGVSKIQGTCTTPR